MSEGEFNVEVDAEEDVEISECFAVNRTVVISSSRG